jgi:TonB family protein
VRVLGDQYAGFTQSCLLLYADHRYHSELRRQESRDNRPRGRWQAPEIFESLISAADLDQLQKIVESGRFRVVNGIVGDPSALRSKIVYTLEGAVVPHTNIEILEAAVAHSSGTQMFEIFGGLTDEQMRNSVGQLTAWVGQVEKRKEGRISGARATNCAMSSAREIGPSPEPTTKLSVTPIFTPSPDRQLPKQKARHVRSLLLKAIVDVDGTVQHVSVERGISPDLDQKALDAVRKWKFVPARLNDVFIPMPVHIEVDFHLY